MIQTDSTSILLADDSQNFLMYVGILTKRLGYKTYLAQDGMEAIKIAKEKKPSIIILDHLMPKIDGTSCLSIIRKDADLMDTPVIVLTSSQGESVKTAFEKLGCCGFLNKPVNIAEFYMAIQKCMPFSIKRRHMRAAINIKVLAECMKQSWEFHATNLSNEGVFLRTVKPFEVGTEMSLVFSIDDEDPVEVKGRVVSKNRLSVEMDAEPGMGIKFLEAPEDIKYRIYYFIMKQISKDLMSTGENTEKEDILDDSLI